MNSSVMPGVAVTAQRKTPSKASPTSTKWTEVAAKPKLLMHCDAATWLLAELDYDDVAFGLFDLGRGRS